VGWGGGRLLLRRSTRRCFWRPRDSVVVEALGHVLDEGDLAPLLVIAGRPAVEGCVEVLGRVAVLLDDVDLHAGRVGIFDLVGGEHPKAAPGSGPAGSSRASRSSRSLGEAVPLRIGGREEAGLQRSPFFLASMVSMPLSTRKGKLSPGSTNTAFAEIPVVRQVRNPAGAGASGETSSFGTLRRR